MTGSATAAGEATGLGPALASASARLRAAGLDAPRHEARLLMRAAAGIALESQLARPEQALQADARARFADLVARRCAREPLAYLVGRREFWSRPFRVGPGVLVPRPESETLVEAALAALSPPGRPWCVLDLGTGSGCLLLAVLSERPRAQGVGVDLGPEALAMAQDNARRLGLAARTALVRGDWGRALAGEFDVVLCNPPYIEEHAFAGLAPEVRDFEPRQALAAGPDGLAAYRALAPDLARLLAPRGRAVLELGQGQGEAVATILAGHGLRVEARRRDLGGIVRALIARHG